MVERFAKEWLAKNAQELKSMPLTAPWNPEGHYHSAFHVLHYNRSSDVSTTGQKIYLGMLKQVRSTVSGYIVELSEINAGSEILEVFVPLSAFLFGAAGNTLRSKLLSLAAAPKTIQVFALGSFSRISKTTLSLNVPHPYYIYIP
jgi:hypothetical protein